MEPVGAAICEIINGQFRAEMRKRGKELISARSLPAG
jgi:hypothetical protein